MDVTCERCGTEYEFDETLLSGRGTSVKCTNCGQVFKVYPRAAGDGDRTTSTWRLQLADGSIDTIDSLRELQRRIASGELTPDNDIARGDDDWKKLGSIPELASFFQAAGVMVEASVPAPAPTPAPAPAVEAAPESEPASEPASASEPESSPEPESASESSLPPGRRPRQPTLLGHAPVARQMPELIRADPTPASGAVSTPAAASEAASASGAGVAVASKEIEDAEFEERPVGSVRPSTPPPSYYDDDDGIPDLPGREWSPLRWLLLIVLVGGLALFATQWERVARLFGVGSNPALIAAGVTEGDAGLAEGHPSAYANAIAAYGRAVQAGGDGSVEVLAKLSNAYALAAQAQLDDGATGDRLQVVQSSALSTARNATELDPRDLEAKLAEADALRLNGDLEGAREVLEAARAISFSRTAEFFRVDARLSAAEAGGGLENGLRSAKQAAELSPEGVRYLLLLARAERASGDSDGARVSLSTILEVHPDHPTASALLAELDAEAAPEAGPVPEAAPEAVPAPEAAPAPTPKKAAPQVNKAPPPAPKPRRAAAPKRSVPKQRSYDEYDRLAAAAADDAFVDGRPPVRDYDWYMKQGRAELAAGNHVRARALFDSALEAKPGSADAMNGLGHVAAAMGDYPLAVRYFRVAAQRGHADGYFNLGRAYERVGQNEKAVSAYYTYLKRRPTGPRATAARTAIKTLEPRAKLPPETESETEATSAPTSEPSSQPKEPSEPNPSPVDGSVKPPAEEPEPARP